MLGKDSHAGTEAIGINSSVKNRFSISKDSQTTANINFNMKSWHFTADVEPEELLKKLIPE